MSDIDALISRVRCRAYVLGALGVAGGFLFGWRSGLSLTIAAAVVILSFLALERSTSRLVPRQDRPGLRTIAPLLLVSAASLLLFAVVLFRWKGFDPIAGAVGLSIVVLSIVPELWIGRPG